MAQVNHRRHARVRGRLPVEIHGSDGTTLAQAIDISRSGMRVEFAGSLTLPNLSSVTIQLNGCGAVSLPVKPVQDRLSTGSDSAPELAVEFQVQNGQHLQALDDYVREHFLHRQGVASPADLRALPRIECSIADVVLRGHNELIDPKVLDISPRGLCLGYTGSIQPQSRVDVEFQVPGDTRPLSLSGIVAYSASDPTGLGRAGIQLTDLGELQEARIRNFVITASAWSSIRKVYRCIWERCNDSGHVLQSADSVSRIFRRAVTESLPVFILSGPLGTACRIVGVDSEVAVLEAGCAVEHEGETHISGAILADGGSYYFRAQRAGSAPDGSAQMILPDELYYSEKRASNRHRLGDGQACVIRLTGISSVAHPAVLIERDETGASLETDCPWAEGSHGSQISVKIAGDSSEQHGEVRHVSGLGQGRYRLGLELGVQRCQPFVSRLSLEDYRSIPASQGGQSVADCAGYSSRPVAFETAGGKRIAGLLNASSYGSDIPVVVIPPAFGKKKEALAPLALVILSTFRKAGQEVAVLRYDGTDRPGESENSLENPQRGYEMLGYRIRQGRDDLEAALQFACANPLFATRQIVIASFSMSSLDTRRLLAETGDRYPVSAWISVMGMPSAKSALTQTLGGLDVVSNYTAGIPNGTCGLLGHLLDMDRVAADLVEEKYAYLSDARADMARISAPVFWIHGTHDKWVYPGEVQDIMTIKSDGARTIAEIPVGHNLRTSDDAKRAFRMVAAYTLQSCCEHAPATTPDRDAVTVATYLASDPPHEEVLSLITSERERLQAFTERNVDEYWRNYLVGSGGEGSGYDFYKNLPQFRAFIGREIGLLSPGSTDRILDTGCGTGILLEALCRSLTEGSFDGTITALDLVPAAVERTRGKIEAVSRTAGERIDATYRAINLEPNRLVPLARFGKDPGQPVEALRGRIEGLTGDHIDQLMRRQGVRQMIVDSCAAEAEATVAGWGVDSELAEVALELNRAYGFLSGRLDGVTTDDHTFNRLNLMGATRTLGLPFARESFDRVISSLFISYLFNADYFLDELYRICAPGARVVVSSMKPDSDISEIFTEYVTNSSGVATDSALAGARQMLSEAAGLFEREEEGFFRFYELEELADMVGAAGFTVTHQVRSLGRPSQAVIVAAEKTR